MKIASIREFKAGFTKYLVAQEEAVVTRRGNPVAVLTPVKEISAGDLLFELRGVLSKAKITKKQIMEILKQTRKKVYG